MKTKTHKAAVLAVSALALTLAAGCGGMSRNEVGGSLIGGVAGAVVGNQFGKGSGKTAATALGAVIGATVGRNVGASLDETSKRRADTAAYSALSGAPVGQSITWENPGNAGGPASGTVQVVRDGRDGTGRTCREFQQTITVGGREEQSYGTACRDEAGDWKLVAAG